MKYYLEILSMLGGLALLLQGMKILSEGLQVLLGERLKYLLQKPATGKGRALGTGIAHTFITQFSGTTIITLLGLLNSGIFTLNQAIPVILGANIGSAITAQIIAFRVGYSSLLLIAAGFTIDELAKKDKWKALGQILLGLGIVFLGMFLISSEISPMYKDPVISGFFAELGLNPVIGIITGILFTVIVQSSSATTGMVISICMAGQSPISLQGAIAILLGANIANSFIVLKHSRGQSLDAKRAAWVSLITKVVAAVIAAVFIGPFTDIMARSSGDLPRQVANAQLFFTTAQGLGFLYLTGALSALMCRVFPGEGISAEKEVKYLDELTLESPATALGLAEMETIRMGHITQSMIESSRQALMEGNTDHIGLVREKERVVDHLDNAIEAFISKIRKEALSESQKNTLMFLHHTISDIERMGDHANNICELAEMKINRKIKFSDEAGAELSRVFDRADESVMYCMNMIQDNNDVLVTRIMHLEKEVDHLVITYENNHMDRLEEGQCSPEAGPIYLDILRNLERITDHTHNIAYAKKHFG